MREADAVAGKTPAEQLMIDRMKGSAAQRAGDNAAAIQAFEAVFNSGKLSGAEQAQVAESLAFAYSQQRIGRAPANGCSGRSPPAAAARNSSSCKPMRRARAATTPPLPRKRKPRVSAAEQAGRKPDEGDLLRPGRRPTAHRQHGRPGGHARQAAHPLPKEEYWSILLGRLPRKSGFSDRFSLDLFRLRLATGNLTKADDFMEMTQLALQAGYPAEGKAVIEKGFAIGALGSGQKAKRRNACVTLRSSRSPKARPALKKMRKKPSRPRAATTLVHVGYCLRHDGPVRQGHRDDRTRHRQRAA